MHDASMERKSSREGEVSCAGPRAAVRSTSPCRCYHAGRTESADRYGSFDVFSLILFEPEIPPNTGNIIRLCANVGARLHLVHPLGFELEERRLRRAGLDYHELACVEEHADLGRCLESLPDARVFALSTKGKRGVYEQRFKAGDAFLLGPETRGLPQELLDRLPPEHILRIPMQKEVRSLNMSNAAAVILYEAWRQLGFAGGA